MANFKISQLPSAATLATEDVLPIVKVSLAETEKATIGQIIDLASGSITSMPNLIVDPVTNFTDFTGSVRNQFTAGDGISISDGVISYSGNSFVSSKLFIASDTTIPHVPTPVFQNSTGISLDLDIQETGLHKFELVLFISCSTEAVDGLDNNFIITTGSDSTIVMDSSNFSFNITGLVKMSGLDSPPTIGGLILPFPNLIPPINAIGSVLNSGLQGAICKFEGHAQITTGGTLKYKLYSMAYTNNTLKVGSYFTAMKV